MVVEAKRMTVTEFDELARQIESADRVEYIGGEIVVSPSNAKSSEIAIEIAFRIKLYLHQNNLPGHVTGESGGYQVSGERYAPDVAFISQERQAELAEEGYNPNPPELAVEVVSPTDLADPLATKVANYLKVGTIVWVVYPKTKQVHVYAPNQPMMIVGVEGVLDGGDVLPGFSLAVKDIFPT